MWLAESDFVFGDIATKRRPRGWCRGADAWLESSLPGYALRIAPTMRMISRMTTSVPIPMYTVLLLCSVLVVRMAARIPESDRSVNPAHPCGTRRPLALDATFHHLRHEQRGTR